LSFWRKGKLKNGRIQTKAEKTPRKKSPNKKRAKREGESGHSGKTGCRKGLDRGERGGKKLSREGDFLGGALKGALGGGGANSIKPCFAISTV